MLVENSLFGKALGAGGADVILTECPDHRGPEIARLGGNSPDRENGGRDQEVPESVEPRGEIVRKDDAVAVGAENRNAKDLHQHDRQQIGDPESRQGDEEKGYERSGHVLPLSRIPCGVDAQEGSEGEGDENRRDIKRQGGRKPFHDFPHHGPVVLDAAEVPGEEIPHDQPVLLGERTIEVELPAEVGLHLCGDLRVQFAPRVGTPRCHRDDEEADDADNEEQHHAQG